MHTGLRPQQALSSAGGCATLDMYRTEDYAAQQILWDMVLWAVSGSLAFVQQDVVLDFLLPSWEANVCNARSIWQPLASITVNCTIPFLAPCCLLAF